MRRVLVTGASGFIGSRLCKVLVDRGYDVRAAIRESSKRGIVGYNTDSIRDVVEIGAIDGKSDWSMTLRDVDTVVHCAARAHVLSETARNPLKAYREVNVDGTKKLICDAVNARVRRIIYLSSIGVYGRSSEHCVCSESDGEDPQTPYAISKWEAECALREIASKKDIEYVIIRPPLVYGPGVPGNFLRLLKLIERGLPLPLGNLRNKRSMIGVDNMADIIIKCIESPKAAGQTFLVSDSETLTVSDLIRRISYHLDRRTRLFSVPKGLFKLMASMAGRKDACDVLLNALVVDSNKVSEMMEWSPPYTVDEELARTANWFRGQYIK